MHVLAISGQHVAVLAAMIYVVLRLFAVPMLFRNPATLGLVWLYIFVAGAPPSAIRAGVIATFVLAAPLFGRQLSPLHFMTTMVAAVLAWNPLLVYSPGFQLSVAAVFGILLLRKPLQAFVKSTVLRPFEKPPELLSNLLAVSLAAQIATTPIIATSFEEVSAIGLLTNLVAVPLSGPILTLGLLGTFAGNIVAPLAYRINASNGFLVTVLIWVAEAASALPIARRGDTGCDASPGRALLPGLYSCCRRRSNAPLEALAEGREPARRMGSTLDCSHRRAFVTLHSFASCLAPVSSARPEVSRSSQGPGNGTPRRGGCQS